MCLAFRFLRKFQRTKHMYHRKYNQHSEPQEMSRSKTNYFLSIFIFLCHHFLFLDFEEWKKNNFISSSNFSSKNLFAQLPARFLIIILKTRFSSLAVNLPHRTRLLPRQVTQDMLQTAALNRDLLSKWDVDDTPWRKKKERDGGKRRGTLRSFFVFYCIWFNAELINRCYNSEIFYT